jgi:predicted Zn-dependent protease
MIERLLFVACLTAAAHASAADSVDSLVEAGHSKRASAMLRGLMAARPKDAHLLYRMAQCQVAFNDVGAAIASARRAVELDPHNKAGPRAPAVTGLVSDLSADFEQPFVKARCGGL